MKIKRQRITLDNLDWKILYALQENARQTYSETGRLLNVAHSTIYDRIKKMEGHGIIKKYTTIVDLEKIGMKYLTAVMTIITNPKESETVAEKLSKFNEILEVYTSLSDELLIIAKVIAENQDKLHSFIAQSVAPLPGVLRIRTSIITKKHKEELLVGPNFNASKEKRSRQIAGKKSAVGQD